MYVLLSLMFFISLQVAHKAVFALLNDIQKADGKPIDPKQTLMKSTCSIMGYICYGNFYNPDSEEVDTILSQSGTFAKAVQFGVICDYIPKAAFLMKNKLREYKELIQNIIDYSDELASIHIDTYDGENMRDLSDMFHKAGEEMNEDEKKVLNVDNRMLKDTVATLFGAGFATIASTLYHSILLMALHPDVQVKVQEEIDRVIGRQNYPNMDDGNDMPYSMAVINEIYRYHSMSAFGFTHATTCDTELDGYFIAEGTPVMFNFWSAHRDPTVFTDPDKFNPDRFLTPDGRLDTKAIGNVIPYGLGQRRCGGEIIARMEVIVFFLTLLQRCVIKEAPEHPLDPEDYIITLGVSLNPFKVSFEPRYVGAFDMDM